MFSAGSSWQEMADCSNAMEWKLCTVWFADDILDCSASTVYRNEISTAKCD